jgi:hypothetical protein
VLKDNPKLIDKAADEIIRWVTPVRHFLRYAQEHYSLHSTTITQSSRMTTVERSGVDIALAAGVGDRGADYETNVRVA